MKTHYLNGKRNHRIDHVIKTLVFDLLPEVENRHTRQFYGIEGPDLEGARRQKIQASARNTPPDSIHQVSGYTFLVASGSQPGHNYSINLMQSTCDCDDFPRIRYCKHIAAIYVHFPQLCPKGSSPSQIPERLRAPDPPQRAPRSDEDSADILLKDINALSQQLNAVTDRSNPDLQALKSVRHSLRAAIASAANRSRPLPEKDVFPPNQKTWAETAERMGVRKAPKRNHGPVGGNTAEKCIGPVKGKRPRKYNDPYAGGERSGKRAKPDAVSAAANESARAVPTPIRPRAAVLARARASPSAAAAGSAVQFFTCGNPSAVIPLAYPSSSTVPVDVFPHLSTVLAPACASPSTAVASSAAHFFTHGNPFAVVLLAYPLSSTARVDAFAHLSAALPGRMFAPLSTTRLGLRQAGTSPEMYIS